MFQFFQASSKVQRDRHIMRETDTRMAKYSRRGLIFNFIAFLICLVGGRFVSENKELTIVLASGLLLITILRGFFLFRFENLYPHGPNRWRNRYFVSTLLGAAWWGIILVSITIQLGIKHETPLLWIYTVVFFATTANAFAPYHRFLSMYQFLGLIPAAGAAMYIGGWNAQIYGALILMFYLILSHQCRLISDNYWEKLEAVYALGHRAASDENEKIENRANLRLSQEFLTNLESEFNFILDQSKEHIHRDHISSLNRLEESITLFNDVIHRNMDISNRVFNIRRELQYLVAQNIPFAELNGVHIETSLSPNLPMRLVGDPVRFGQIISTLIEHVVQSSQAVACIVDVQFLREYESAGELYISMRRMRNKSSLPFFGDSVFSDSKQVETPRSLSLTLAKALAEFMEGDIQIISSADNDFQLRFNARLGVVDDSGHLDFHKNCFSGSHILLVSPFPSILDIKKQELEALGFNVSTETQYKRVKSSLSSKLQQGQGLKNVMIYHVLGSESSLASLQVLKDMDEFRSINKIVAVTAAGRAELEEAGLLEDAGFYFVSVPLGLFELESTFEYLYSLKETEHTDIDCEQGTIIIASDYPIDDTIQSECNALLNQLVLQAPLNELRKVLVDSKNSIVVVPCDESTNVNGIVDEIRKYDSRIERGSASITPIIGVGNSEALERSTNVYEAGLDDFVDPGAVSSKTLLSTLRYWRSLATA